MLRAALALALLEVPAQSAEHLVYWGDVHGHTSLSDGKGSLDDYFTYARDIAKLDFVIVTDHDFGSRAPWRMPKENWKLIQDKADEFTVPGHFVAIGGYEWTSQPQYWSGVTNGPSERLFPGPPMFYNHKNVYFTNRIDYLFSAKDTAYNNPDALAGAVRKHGGLIHNNHPFAFGNDTRDQWEYAPTNSSVIVNTEMGPDTNRYQGKRYELNWEQMMRGFLNRGGRTGFVAGTDTHEGKPAGRTAILARELTRAALFEALRHRRNYAVNHARIVLDFRINGHLMGEEITVQGSPQLVVDVKGTDAIEEIVIVRDGSVIYSVQPKSRSVRFEYEDHSLGGASYYYVRVRQSDVDEHGNHSHAWSSPIWVKRKQSPPPR